MNAKILGIILGLALAATIRPASARAASTPAPKSTARAPLKITPTADGVGRVTLSEEEWKKILTPDQFRVLRKAGTEVAFTGKYWNNHAKGIYRCAGCGLELFSSEAKFESGTGWPSFFKPFAENHVTAKHDATFGMERTAIECARCGGHLGHLFEDGPAPTHLRYCMNSAALEFVPAK